MTAHCGSFEGGPTIISSDTIGLSQCIRGSGRLQRGLDSGNVPKTSKHRGDLSRGEFQNAAPLYPRQQETNGCWSLQVKFRHFHYWTAHFDLFLIDFPTKSAPSSCKTRAVLAWPSAAAMRNGDRGHRSFWRLHQLRTRQGQQLRPCGLPRRLFR